MNIAVIGLSHKTAPVDVREKLSVPEDVRERALQHLCGYAHIQEATILSTCNRLEIYIVTSDTEVGVREVHQFLSEWSHIPLPQLRPYLFILLHQDAVMHLMRVASGLDSLVIGEGQILSQVKRCHQLGQQYKSIGSILNRLFTGAIAAGKRVRTETSIGTGAVSISSAAVELADLRLQNLQNCRIAIVGAGKMSRLVVQHLIARGVKEMSIINRSLERAQELAQQFPEVRFELFTMTDLLPIVAAMDLVFTGTAATQPLLDRENLGSVLTGDRPLSIIDISVPRNVHANVTELASVQLFNVDDLEAVVAQNQEARRQLAQEAEGILEEELETFLAWWHALETIPTIRSLRQKMEAIRTQELEKALSRLGSEFGEKHQGVIEAMTRTIINKILHDPTVQLQSQRDLESRQRAMQTLQDLFNLEPIEA
ncbi:MULTISPECIES: glutamyl-tRNA reductase [unclassified Thermosynechococcus]|uniref:glutamyl-tRNA reductase n=1 Tax=unclassified Thermosynechococcus TaxID=2622553 RepID=UPI001981F531|nr:MULTISPECIES: glutamyl-tRNA reductase [unclassified Thermosynechococcus]MDR5639891.1 glutamyl-tRNA reductase [Thermosynechococcus sp. PP42]MDR7922050.1 glutamyl-tRNA reductase [Thermosynechococcus sp. HY213]QSF48896.1 glutamyl-tRNA reductase [Thermosynechococcus sp. TA-1]WJI23017.1 glutamyl-tRNA reductase [Thermosynechococcus sp. B0]WJI25532.1 glutamyl-tRNA reductase [Thermosynechococcus sp. B1]